MIKIFSPRKKNRFKHNYDYDSILIVPRLNKWRRSKISGFGDDNWSGDSYYNKAHKNCTLLKKKKNSFIMNEDVADLKSLNLRFIISLKTSVFSKFIETVYSLKDSVYSCSSKINNFPVKLNKPIANNSSVQNEKKYFFEYDILNWKTIFSFSKNHLNSKKQQNTPKLHVKCMVIQKSKIEIV